MISKEELLKLLKTWIKVSDLPNYEKILEDLKNEDTLSRIEKGAYKVVINSIILVKNQENLIKRSITSADALSDNIYVFDTGSTDQTLQVINEIKKNNRKINLFDLEWEDNYAFMRNKVDQFITKGWIFFIDSDEELRYKTDIYDVKILLSFLDCFFPKFDLSLQFKQLGGNSVVTNWVERLYRKSESVYFWGAVHEELRSSRRMLTLKTQFTLYNYGREEEQKEKFNKESRYFDLLQKNISIEPENVKWTALLPYSEAVKRDVKWYRKQLENFIEVEESFPYNYETKDSFFYETIYIDYAKLLIDSGEVDNAILVLERGKKRYPSNTSIISLYYFMKNLNIVTQSYKILNGLKNDIKIMKNDPQFRWSEYSSTQTVEEVLVKLLFKCEEYQSALLMMNDFNAHKKDSLIIKELLFCNLKEEK